MKTHSCNETTLAGSKSMKTHSCNETTLAGSKLVMHKDSHTISKEKPKIRIIHIVAPEIIKTDVENFRGIVQRLTGKSLGKATANIKRGENVPQQRKIPKLHKKENPNAYLSFLGDGFMHGVDINEFPLLQFRSNSQTNTFGHTPLF